MNKIESTQNPRAFGSRVLCLKKVSNHARLTGMKKGFDYTGIAVSAFCHDGEGNFLMHRRTARCRDEHGCWDFGGGGGLEFNETLLDGIKREVKEEYGVTPLEIEFMGVDEIFRTHNERNTHWISFRYKIRVDREYVVNAEPDKHEELTWVRLDSLPAPLHSQIIPTLEKYKEIL